MRGMGSALSLLWSWPTPQKIVMVGLDGAGKTTLLYRLKRGESTPTIPTIGFNVEQVTICGSPCTVWDVGGQTRLRALWSHYLEGTSVLVFVVDSQDHTRLTEAGLELRRMLAEPALADSAILILGNKQDLPNAVSCERISALMHPDVESRRWFVQPCCATTGDGVDAGMRWVASLRPKSKSWWWWI